LSHAHAAGILHLDIKPENIILIAQRAAKLLDFGLAKSLVMVQTDELTRGALTRPSIAGTIGYMSPEQIRNGPLDVRSDLFQAGAVLYEMLTGRAAFPGATVAERLAAVLTRDPAPLEGSPEMLAAQAVVSRALARDPARRYPSAAAMLSDLMRASAGEWPVDLPDTLAVLDFRNLTSNAEDDWIGSGVAESVGLVFGLTPGIMLAPRDAVLRARAAARGETLEAIAVEVGLGLGCRWVLAGTYHRLGPALRMTTELFEVSTGRRVGGDELAGTLEQVFDLQERIVAATCASLAVETTGRRNAPRTALSAYECYARGRREAVKYERGAFDRARDFYEKAVALDPGYARALAGLAHAYAMRYTHTSDRSVLEAAIGFAQRAIDADATLAEPHIWLGYALRRLGREADAVAAFQRTRELDPSEFYGFYFAPGETRHWRQDPERAVTMYQRAIELDPLKGFAWWALGALHFVLGRYAEAASCFEGCARLDSMPNGLPVPGIEGYLAECLRRSGRLDEARIQCLAGLDSVERTDFMYRDTTRIFCLIALGRTAADQRDVGAARAAFEQAIAQIKGRPRTLAGGTLLVRSLAGLSRLTLDRGFYDEASERFAHRDEFDFSWVPMCEDCDTCLDLAEAASAFGLDTEARIFLERARDP
jgi:serine/threonine-protein kinase